jgi:two-component system response regulator NreC
MIRILIADDHGVLRAGLRALLNAEPDLEVVGEVADGYETLRLAGELHPDVVLLDISMPGIDGIEVARRLKAISPGSRTLILTVHEDGGLLQEAIDAGAMGYIIKRAIDSDLINAIHTVWRGDLYVYPTMVHALVRGQPSSVPDEAPEKLLTTREIQILRLIAQGYTNRQAAEALSLSVRTVEGHRASLKSKLGLRSRVDLAHYAKEQGFLSSGSR